MDTLVHLFLQLAKNLEDLLVCVRQTFFAVQVANRTGGDLEEVTEAVRGQLQQLVRGQLISLATPPLNTNTTPLPLTKSPRIKAPNSTTTRNLSIPEFNSAPPEKIELKARPFRLSFV